MDLETYATCRHCGHEDKVSEFKTVWFKTGGLVVCPNKDCDAVDDPGVWLRVERV